MEDNKVKAFMKKMGLRFMSTFSNKSIEQLEKEKEANEIIDNLNEKFSNLIERLEEEQLTEEEINSIVSKCEEMRKKALEDFDKILNSGDLDDMEEIKALRDITFEKENLIKEAKENALSNMIKQEEVSVNKDTDISIDNQEEKTDGTVLPPIMSFGGEQAKTQPMTAVPDDAPTAIPVKKPELDMELDEPELDEPEIDFPELPQEDSEPQIEETNLDSNTEEHESEEDNEPEVEPSVEEEPVVSEGVDITSEITNESVQNIDLSQCSDWHDYIAIYFAKSGIDIKDVHRFYKDIYNGNYPSDFIDEKTFAIEKQRLEDEKEYKKLEAERAETEKRLREIEEKQAALSEEHTELQARFIDRDAKLAALRKSNVSLKQELVDKDGELKDKNQEINGLQGQLTAAQQVAKKAQAQSYKDRERISEIEKKLDEERAQVKELKQELEMSKGREAEINKKLEETTAKINKNIELAKKQISSLNDHDDIEKTALEWSITGPKESEKEEKKGPKHFAEKKPKHKTTKEDIKVETKETEKKSEEKQPAPIFEMPKPAEEPKVIAVSATPDPELQGVVMQDTDGHVKVDFKPLEEIAAEKKELEATRADLVSAIEKEAEEMVGSNEGKTR